MPKGQCLLCAAESELQLSHVLPAFVFRWMRESSGNGYMRLGSSPNQRVQDGVKRYWLCTSCEGLLNCSETAFATKLFHPYTSGESTRIIYGEWLLRFCVSVSWRVLQFHKEETSLKRYESDAVARIAEAEATWKAFLLGQRPHPGHFEQHLVPFDAIESISNGGENLSPNLNRYLMRAVDMDLLKSETTNFAYAKLGRFVILGFIREDRPNRWQRTKVHVKTGRIEPCQYTMPRELFEYLNSRARHVAGLLSGVSRRQSEKIDQAFRSNVEKYVGSDEFVAMQNDVRMFGDAAFTREHSLEEDGPKDSVKSS
jgi:hypothetical protein